MGNFIYYAVIGVSMHRISLSLQQISLLQYRINGNMEKLPPGKFPPGWFPPDNSQPENFDQK